MRTTAVLLVATFALCPRAHARILDDFTQGSVNISAGATAVIDVESGLDPNHTIGGIRRVMARDNVSISINDPTPTPQPGATFDQGALSFSAEAEFKYGDDASLNVNLFDDGARLFRVMVSGEHRLKYLDQLWVVVRSDDGTGASTGFREKFDRGGIATGLLPFNIFSISHLTDVDRITLRLTHGVPGATSSPEFSVLRFDTIVPEPSTIAMAMASVVCLGAMRRSVRSCRRAPPRPGG
jgi:hypothetical protein